MKLIKYLLVINILLIFNEAHSQWIIAYNPFNGYVSSLSVIDSSIFAGSKGNLFVSYNDGKNWTSINLTKPDIEITSIAGSHDKIVVSTAGEGVFISSNNGASWSPINNGLTNLNVSSVALKDSHIFAGTSGNGIFYSSDWGRQWSNINIGILNLIVKAIIILDSVVVVGSNNGEIFLSNDFGNNWNLMYSTNNFPITSFVAKVGLIFAGSNGGGVYVSQDSGQQWAPSNNGIFNNAVTSLAVSDSSIFAGTMSSGVFHSTNNGESWSIGNDGLTDSLVTSLASLDSNIFAGTENGGVFRSSDNGLNWNQMNTGLVSARVVVLLTDSLNVFAGTVGGGILLSTDQGKSWTELNNGLTDSNVVSLAIYDSTLYAATWGTGIFKSTDYGRNWMQKTPFSGTMAMSDSVLYATADGVLRSIDGGTSWTNLGLQNEFLRVVAAKDSLVMVGSYIYKGVFLSSNYGNDWDSIGAPYAYSSVNFLGWVRGNIITGIDYGIYITTDTGAHWIRKDPYKPNPLSVYSMAIKDSILIAGTYHGVYLSTDWGENWTSINSGLTGPVYAVAIVGSDLFAGDLNQNIWKRSLNDIVVEVKGEKKEVISKFDLIQNYPNPFNPTTKIKYSVPSSEIVQLKVYDVLGNEITTLVNEVKPAGIYEVEWDASRFSSGVYFYQLNTGSYINTKKMVLLR